jgi:hypothetical protein
MTPARSGTGDAATRAIDYGGTSPERPDPRGIQHGRPLVLVGVTYAIMAVAVYFGPETHGVSLGDVTE